MNKDDLRHEILQHEFMWDGRDVPNSTGQEWHKANSLAEFILQQFPEVKG